MAIEKLKFPIGKLKMPGEITVETISTYIQDIADFPERLKGEVIYLRDPELDTPYRPGGWTIRQVVHHCADSHMNSLIRFKLALTENKPVIKPYFEDRWAELSDSKIMSILPSLEILAGIHQRWVHLLQGLTNQQWKSTFIHPEQGREYRLDESLGLYAWHCNHHLAHIINLKRAKGWVK